MELHSAPRLGPQATAAEVCARYAARLPLTSEERGELLAFAIRGDAKSEDIRAAMTALHRSLAGQRIDKDNPAYASIQRRIELAYPQQDCAPVPAMTRDVLGRERLPTAPPLVRSPMAARPWRLGLFARRPGRTPPAPDAGRRDATSHEVAEPACDSPDPLGRWHRVASFRRFVLLGLILSQTYIAASFMSAVLPYHGRQPLEIAILVLFTVLFGWVSAGFWTAIAGYVLLLIGSDRYAISRTARSDAPIDPGARVAIVVPICNESAPRVFAGLRASYESLDRSGALEHFDFFVLSDTSNPDTRVAEIAGWVDMCRAVNGFGRVFYRWRQHHIKRKSGNIADFCRRWGKNYRYMVVFDADSMMSGECLTTLLRLIEANPNVGIIQTAPRATGRDTFYARVQQFATRVYGPLFTAGLHFWQLGESHYWGHNAIIRVVPFMRHCALRRLPGRGSLSGEILSHDFVEAALMRRAGWAVSIAYDLRGSYEEMPPNLVDELTRDRRWCQGNLMNVRLFMMKGLHIAHRAVFMSGVMAYLSALLWFVFLLLSTVLLALHTLSEPKYFVQPYQLFPLWPEWHPEWAVALFGATALLLFLPKILSVLLIWARSAKRYGGPWHLMSSMLAEFALSVMLAPIRMLFHTQFVLAAFFGWAVQWKSPPREDSETTWTEALRRHGWHTLLGVAWAGGVYWLNPSFLVWLLPVVGALILSVPLSVYTSRVSLGRKLRAARLLVIPEEVEPPVEIQAMTQMLKGAAAPPGFIEAVVDPVINALVCAAGVARFNPTGPLRDQRPQLLRAALRDGPKKLSATRKIRLLGDPVALSELHMMVWTSPDTHESWREAVATASQVIEFPRRKSAPAELTSAA